MSRALLFVLVVYLLVIGHGAADQGVSVMKDVPLRQFCTVLEHVRAKPINEEEAVFSFGFKGQTKHFLLVKNTDIDPRVKRAYHGIDTTGFKNSLAVVFGGWERPMVFFFFSKILVLILF